MSKFRQISNTKTMGWGEWITFFLRSDILLLLKGTSIFLVIHRLHFLSQRRWSLIKVKIPGTILMIDLIVRIEVGPAIALEKKFIGCRKRFLAGKWIVKSD